MNLLKGTNEEKSSKIIFAAVWIAYAILAMVRSCYSSAIAPIIADGLLDKSQSGIINAGFYLFYGGAQLLGAKLLDKVSPVKLITVSLFCTLIVTVGMSLARDFYTLLILWCFCGLMQFGVWPAVVRVLAEYVLPRHRNKAKFYISFAYCIGTILAFLMATVVLKVTSWPALFAIMTVVVIGCIAFWLPAIKKSEPVLIAAQTPQAAQATQDGAPVQKPNLFKLMLLSGVMLILIPTGVRTALDLGLKAWVPTMIMDNYNVTPSFASAINTVLLFVNIIGVFIVFWIYPKKIRNEVTMFTLVFATILPFVIALLMTGKVHMAVIVILLAVVTTIVYGGNQIAVVLIPSCFAKFNCTGSITSLINSVSSFGAMAANFGFGFLAQKYGWDVTIWSWIIITAVSVVLCAVAIPVWKKFMMTDNN